MKARSTSVELPTIEPHLSRVVRIVNLGLTPPFTWDGRQDRRQRPDKRVRQDGQADHGDHDDVHVLVKQVHCLVHGGPPRCLIPPGYTDDFTAIPVR